MMNSIGNTRESFVHCYATMMVCNNPDVTPEEAIDKVSVLFDSLEEWLRKQESDIELKAQGLRVRYHNLLRENPEILELEDKYLKARNNYVEQSRISKTWHELVQSIRDQLRDKYLKARNNYVEQSRISKTWHELVQPIRDQLRDKYPERVWHKCYLLFPNGLNSLDKTAVKWAKWATAMGEDFIAKYSEGR